MEIEEEDLLTQPGNPIDPDVFLWDEASANSDETRSRLDDGFGVLRHKITSSPIVKDMYRLRYSTNKPHEGLAAYNSAADGSLLTPQMLKDLKPADPDSFGMGSQLDDDLEAEMLKATSKAATGNQDIERVIEDTMIEDAYKPELEEIVVFIHHSAITVADGSTFEIPSTVRSSNILRGKVLDDGSQEEDSLIICLSSHLVLLIRFFLVEGDIKPFVVQWWRASHLKRTDPKPHDVGKEILTHQSGSAIAVCALQNVIRLYYCSQTPRGVMLERLQNLTFDGTIIHSCFLELMEGIPIDSLAMLCSLMVTSGRRYLVRLFEWRMDEDRITEHTPFLLPNEFDIPVFVFPFKQSMFMMMEKEIILMSANNILSADFNFTRSEFPGSFPVSHYRPLKPILADSETNEVLIATEDGTIYSIVIYDTIIDIRPIVRMPRVNNFTLEKQNDGYHFIYTSNVTNNGYIIFSDIIHDAKPSDAIQVSRGEVIHSWSNWASLSDIDIVESKNGQQEIWLAHGKSISKMKNGLAAKKTITDPTLKHALKVYRHVVGADLFFIFAFLDRTLVFKLEDDALVDVDDSGLVLDQRTVHVSSVQDICFQITEDSIVVSDFEDEDGALVKEFDDVLFCADCFQNVIGALFERTTYDGTAQAVLSLFHVAGAINELCPEVLLDVDPNFVKLIGYQETLLAIIGTYGRLVFYALEENHLTRVLDLELGEVEPHDLVAVDYVIYLSTRKGEYIAYSITGSIHDLILEKKYSFNICDAPIDFVIDHDDLIMISKGMWKLKYGAKFVVPVVFSELRERVVYSAVPINDENYALIRDDGFSIVRVTTSVKPVLKTIKIGTPVRRLKYIPHLRIFAVLSEKQLLFASKHARLEDRPMSRRMTTSLFDGESPLSLCEWVLPSEEKKFINLLVGCASEHGGSLKVLKLQVINDDGEETVLVLELFAVKTPGAVLAIAQLDDGAIVYSSGSDLFVCSYNLASKKMNESVQTNTFRSLVTEINVRGNIVLVTTKDGFSSRFCYENGLLVLQSHNINGTSHSLMLENEITISTGKIQCCITGTSSPSHPTGFVTFPGFVPKIKIAELVPNWYKPDSSLKRFIAFGFAGEIEVYTIVRKDEVKELEKYYSLSTDALPDVVTRKGLWEVEGGPWYDTRNIRTFSSDMFDVDSPDSVCKLLASVSI